MCHGVYKPKQRFNNKEEKPIKKTRRACRAKQDFYSEEYPSPRIKY